MNISHGYIHLNTLLITLLTALLKVQREKVLYFKELIV